MKAIVYTSYGLPEVLQLKEIEKPTPIKNQVLIRVHAASINALDYRRFETLSSIGRFMEEKLIKSVNKVLGSDIAGIIESVGPDVKYLHPGDEVFGTTIGNMGGFSEYVCTLESNVVLKPKNISFEEAAAVPVAATTAYHALQKMGTIIPNQQVLIHGASGGVGTYVLQLAKAHGLRVTAVASTRHIKLIRSLGVDDWIDYTKTDFLSTGKKYDRIIVVNGNRPVIDYWRVLAPKGICIIIGGAMSQIFQSMLFGPILSLTQKKLHFLGISKENKSDLEKIKTFLEKGKIKSIVDRTFPLNETRTAINYILRGDAKGKIVIAIK